MLRIGIVNDLEIALEVLRRVVSSSRDYEVAWIARDGAEAVQKCAQEVPDIILMDLIMPVMNGVEATRQIMQKTPCAILVVTASVGINASMVFEAMGAGALDAAKTPVFGASFQIEGAQPLLNKMAMIGRLIEKPKVKPIAIENLQERFTGDLTPLVAIGASTGGPMALAYLLAHLPMNFPAAIAIIQHVDFEFAQGLTEWLSQQSMKKVSIAVPGMRLAPGQIVLAGGKDHLAIARNLHLKYTSEVDETSYCPSVDVFFNSLAAYWPREQASRSTALLLTGMGRDGAAGLKALRDKGWHTIAEDKESCIVYGMPKAAIEMDAAEEILPLNKIAPSLINFYYGKK